MSQKTISIICYLPLLVIPVGTYRTYGTYSRLLFFFFVSLTLNWVVPDKLANWYFLFCYSISCWDNSIYSSCLLDWFRVSQSTFLIWIFYLRNLSKSLFNCTLYTVLQTSLVLSLYTSLCTISVRVERSVENTLNFIIKLVNSNRNNLLRITIDVLCNCRYYNGVMYITTLLKYKSSPLRA